MIQRRASLALKALVYAVATGLLVLTAFLVLAPRATHGETLEVLTGSMRPTIQPGSLVFVRPVDPNELRVGDIATYQTHSGKSSLVTHRVVAVHRDERGLTFTFKGDANSVADPQAVPAAALHGRVWLTIPYAGEARALAGTRAGYVLLVLLPALTYMIGMLRKGMREGRAARTRPAGSADVCVDSSTPGQLHSVTAVLARAPFEQMQPILSATSLPRATIDLPDGRVAVVVLCGRERARELADQMRIFAPRPLHVCAVSVGDDASTDLVDAERLAHV